MKKDAGLTQFQTIIVAVLLAVAVVILILWLTGR